MLYCNTKKKKRKILLQLEKKLPSEPQIVQLPHLHSKYPPLSPHKSLLKTHPFNLIKRPLVLAKTPSSHPTHPPLQYASLTYTHAAIFLSTSPSHINRRVCLLSILAVSVLAALVLNNDKRLTAYPSALQLHIFYTEITESDRLLLD